MRKYSKSWRDFKPSTQVKIINKILRRGRQTTLDDHLVMGNIDELSPSNRILIKV